MHYSKEEYDFEPFDLERAKKGDAVCTREGEKVNISNLSYLPFPYQYPYPLRISLNTHESYNKDISCMIDGRHIKGRDSKYDLFHPVRKKSVKTKRIEFDASRVSEEGVTIECRIPEDWIFKKILATDLDSESPLAVVVNNRTKDYLVNLRPDGRSSEGDDGDYDLVLVVPDVSPSLPSMQEVAIKNESMYRVDSIGRISPRTGPSIYYCNDQDIERVKAYVQLMNVARFVNDGWEPDWSEETTKWFFQLEFMGHLVGYKIDTNFNYQKNLGGVYFKSEEAANYARKILNSWEPGDAILKRALGVKL